MHRTAILWLRSDLRLHDHPALATALAEHERVVALFVLDDALLAGRAASGPRARFLLGCLAALDAELRARGGALVVRRGRPERELPALATALGAATVLWTSDVSPYARARDRRVTEALRAAGVAARPHGGRHLTDPSRPRTGQGEPFRVFSPFHRAITALPRREVLPAPAALPPLPAGLDPGGLPAAAELGLGPDVPEPVCAPGEPAARAALEAWLDGPVDRYADRATGMARAGASALSPYLRWGCLSARECEARAQARGGEGARAWTRQLAWRDFHAHVLLHHPEILDRELQPRFRGTLGWEDDPALLDAWREGRTGYPLVDAGMRQLAATGWMHNRARLVVGSFLTRDLQLDWRLGERHFSALLLDGEPAQNAGNWQWVASTGVDPQPHFKRVLNPTLQAQRFDPDGAYVRRWVPELEGAAAQVALEPWTVPASARGGYPDPVVDHRAERGRALQRYRDAIGRASAG